MVNYWIRDRRFKRKYRQVNRKQYWNRRKKGDTVVGRTFKDKRTNKKHFG